MDDGFIFEIVGGIVGSDGCVGAGSLSNGALNVAKRLRMDFFRSFLHCAARYMSQNRYADSLVDSMIEYMFKNALQGFWWGDCRG